MLSKPIYLTIILSWIFQISIAQFEGTGVVGPTVPRQTEIDDPFNDGEVLQNNRDDISSAIKPHPLGLLPTPVLRTDTRYTFDDLFWRKIDTSIYRFHEYNPISKLRYPNLFLGNLAQNYSSLVFNPERQIGLQTGIEAYQAYWMVPEKVKYYNTKIPFTSIYYNLGSHVENFARATHSQNIGPYYNFSFDYRMMNSQGAYQRQKTLMHNLNINNWFNSKTHRYTLMFAYIFNKMGNFENGGVDFDQLFNKAFTGIDRATIPINLSGAENDAKNNSLNLKQMIFLGEKRNVKTSDTTAMDIVQRKSAISYTFNYSKWKYKYIDTESDSSYYNNFFNDSTKTADSTLFWTVKHSIRWENVPETYTENGSTLSKFRYFASLDYTYTKYNNLDLQRKWSDILISGGINTNLLVDRKWHYGFLGQVSIGPNSVGDFRLSVFGRWKINDMMNLIASAESSRRTPSQREQEYRSNHFMWLNDFNPVYHTKASLLFRCSHGFIEGELSYHNMQQYIFRGQNLDLQQAPDGLNVLVFRASKAFDWKHIYFYNEVTAQYISDRDQLRLPKFLLKQSLFYKGGFVKGLLTAHLGFDIKYNTDYFADGYNPAIMEFYRQDNKKLAFYPVIDAFFEIFIKRARIFFLVNNVNQGMFRPKGYYAAPDYPSQDRAFKAGVSWQFYD